jgi:hypothetical protein
VTLTVRYVDARRQRPPRVELRLDVRVSNDDDAERWALMPDTLAEEPREPGPAVWSIAAWQLGGLRRAFLLHATGDAGWYAVLVPPRATVTVAGLPFAWWGPLPEAVDVPVQLAADLTIDGAPLPDRLGAVPASDPGATVDGMRTTDPAAVLTAVTGTPAEPLQVGWTTAGGSISRARLDGADQGPLE